MATGMHWEWRGFGEISHALRSRFEALPLAYGAGTPWLDVVDEYLWVPGCQINVKLRAGIEDGLKLKRLLESDPAGIELWNEDPDDLFPFSRLDASAFERLSEALHIRLPAGSSGPWDRASVLAYLERATPRPRVVVTRKRRQTRRLGQGGGAILVELAELGEPERVTSVGLENAVDLAGGADEQTAAAKAALLAAIESLELTREPLAVTSYLGALEFWSAGRTIAGTTR